jgi:hypothetical protein
MCQGNIMTTRQKQICKLCVALFLTQLKENANINIGMMMETWKLAGIPLSGPNPFQGMDQDELLELIDVLKAEIQE